MTIAGPASSRYLWVEQTIGEQLRSTAERCGESLAMVCGQRRFTWSDVDREVDRIAGALYHHGTRRGDRVATWLPNRAEWVLLWLAAARLGAMIVPINSRYTPDEAGYILRQSGATQLFALDRFLEIDFVDLIRRATHEDPDMNEPPLMLRHVVFITEDRDIEPAGLPSAMTWHEFRQDTRSVPLLHPSPQFSDPVVVVYTSGTTGYPKGAVHTHQILRNELSISEWMGIDSHSRILNHMPFFHVAGCMTGVLPGVITGAALILMDTWDPSSALKLIASEGITVLGGIPTHFVDLLSQPDLATTDVSSLDSGWIGGASPPQSVIETALETLGYRTLLPVYGMTETTSVTTFPRPDDSRPTILSGRGVPVSDFEVKIAAPSGDGEAKDGQDGEVLVRGHVVMSGYWENEDATSAAIDSDGWFHTGDVGNIDSHGYLGITGRLNDIYIVGGANVYPAEIERIISSMPGVVQSSVVGVPDERLGELGVAFVQRREGSQINERDVQTYCSERLAKFKIPAQVVFVDPWPTTATGKTDRLSLGRAAMELQTNGRTTDE